MTKDRHLPMLQHRKTATARYCIAPGSSAASSAFVVSSICFPASATASNTVTLQRRGRTVTTRRTTATANTTTSCTFFAPGKHQLLTAHAAGRRIVVSHQLQHVRGVNTVVGRCSYHRSATIQCNGQAESESTPASDSSSQSAGTGPDESSSAQSSQQPPSQAQPSAAAAAGATPQPQQQQQQQAAQTDYLTQLNDARLSDRQVGDEVTILGRVVSTSSNPTNAVAPPPLTSSSSSSSSSTAASSQSLTSPSPTATAPPPLEYSMARRALWRLSWVVWWPQFVLTLISAAILLFAAAFPSVSLSVGASSVGLLLTASATILSLVSVLHTYLYTRLSRRMVASSSDGNDEGSSLKKSTVKTPLTTGRFVTGLVLALIGLVVGTSGLHATTGVLLARLLTSGFGGGVKNGSGGVVVVPNQAFAANGQLSMGGLIQPVDVLVVQAAANTIAAFLLAAVLSTWFVSRVKTWERKAVEKAQLDQIQREVQQQQQQ